MRILLTADPAIPVPPSGYGGIERIVDALAREYRHLGHAVGLAAHPKSTCAVDSFFPWRGDSALRNTAALFSAVRKFRPDVVHSFSRLAYLYPLVPGSVPKVMSYQRHVGGPQIRWAARLGGRSMRFTGCSEFIARMGRAHGGEWTPVPNFVETDKIRFEPSVPADAPLLFLSRIESIKGADLAIEIAKASGRRLVLAGNKSASGPERDYFENAILPNIGKDRIEYVGEVNDSQKNVLLGQAAALLVPIRWDEPFGIVFAEALAAGTPVITCARGAAPEIVDPGVTGFFVTGAEDGTAAVGQLGRIQRSACRASAEARFSRPICAAQYLELYASMGARGHTARV
ncbi:MAG TPA: glycosyltransferase [Opitutaceae bacterium]